MSAAIDAFEEMAAVPSARGAAGLRAQAGVGTTVVVAAGGTGGHFFPAEALAAELTARGCRVVLMTDARSGGLSSPVFRAGETHVLPGAGIAGRGALRGAAAVAALAAGTVSARRLLARLRPAVVVGFGGYPCVAPVLAARLSRHRSVVMLHEQNAVLGRANRALARFADWLALGLDNTARLPAHPPAVVIGNPVRPAVLALAGAPYVPPAPDGPIDLLVTGGSLGARVFSVAVPAALALLPPALLARLRVVQQCRAEDLDRVRTAYAALHVPAELSAFFDDLPQRMARAHLVLARAGASTVAEVAVLGRPALLVPLPGAIDGHQARNAEAVGAEVLTQSSFEHDPAVLAAHLAALLADPAALVQKAHGVAAHGRPHAARDLADLVLQLAAERTTP